MSDALQDALTKLRVGISKSRTRLQDSFQDFDKLRSGTVTVEQFKRCLSKASVIGFLDEVDVMILTQSFPGNGGPDRFCYTAFLKEVNAVDLPANTIVASLSPKRAAAAGGANDLDAQVLAKVTKGFVHQMVTKSLDVAIPFKGFDHHHQGKVTEAQFERAFPFATEQHVMALLKQRYSDGYGNVEYKSWVEDMRRAVEAQRNANAPPASPLSPASARAAGLASGNTMNEVSDLLNELRGQFARSRVRIDESLKDFDRAHTGIITATQFRSALGSIKLVRFMLTGKQLDDLVARYQVESFETTIGAEEKIRVNYRAFLKEVGDDSLEPNSPIRQQTTTQGLSAEEQRSLDRILNKVRSTIRTRRMNMKPTFQDFDRASKGIYQCRTCTRTRFQRALAINKVTLSPAEVDLLEKCYSVRLPGEGESDAINYVAFCADVDVDEQVEPIKQQKLGSIANANVTQASQNFNATHSSPARGIQTIIDDVAQQCSLRRIRLAPFFKDFDPLRSNSISADKFTSAISMASVRLSEKDLDALAAAYSHESLPHACRYSNFIAAVEAQNVDLSGTAHLQPNAKDATEARQLNEVHERIAKTVKGRGILLPPFFGDYDKHHCGRITGTQFQQTISRHRFPVSTAEVELLTKHYSCPTDPLMVRYRPFLAAIDESEDISAQHQARLATRQGKADAAASRGAAGSPDEEAVLVNSIRQKVVIALRKGARLQEFFRDADGLRKGYIPCGKFESALDMCSIHFSDKELSLLTKTYSHPELLDMVEYKRFMATIDELDDEDQLLKTQQAAAGHSGTVALQSNDLFFNKLVERIRKHKLTTRRASAGDLFKSFDKLHKGRVTKEQFFAVMTSLGVRLSQAESDVLVAELSCGNNEVNYLAFSRSIDKEE